MQFFPTRKMISTLNRNQCGFPAKFQHSQLTSVRLFLNFSHLILLWNFCLRRKIEYDFRLLQVNLLKVISKFKQKSPWFVKDSKSGRKY